jgi:hypothetical protein
MPHFQERDFTGIGGDEALVKFGPYSISIFFCKKAFSKIADTSVGK